jgi:hypothetical protein
VKKPLFGQAHHSSCLGEKRDVIHLKILKPELLEGADPDLDPHDVVDNGGWFAAGLLRNLADSGVTSFRVADFGMALTGAAGRDVSAFAILEAPEHLVLTAVLQGALTATPSRLCCHRTWRPTAFPARVPLTGGTTCSATGRRYMSCLAVRSPRTRRIAEAASPGTPDPGRRPPPS